MKTGSVNLNFLCNFSQLPLSNISLFTVLLTADVGFFGCFPAPPLCFCPYPQFSLEYKRQLFEISSRPTLVSVSFSSLLLDIGHLEKSFAESIM